MTENDCLDRKLKTVEPQERSTWRSGVRSAMPAASQLEGGPLMSGLFPAILGKAPGKNWEKNNRLNIKMGRNYNITRVVKYILKIKLF